MRVLWSYWDNISTQSILLEINQKSLLTFMLKKTLIIGSLENKLKIDIH